MSEKARFVFALIGAFVCGMAAANRATIAVPPPSDNLMAIIVWSDGTAKAGPITADDCARLAEYAYDGKVFRPKDGDDKPFAMAFSCAPETLLKRSFGTRHTP